MKGKKNKSKKNLLLRSNSSCWTILSAWIKFAAIYTRVNQNKQKNNDYFNLKRTIGVMIIECVHFFSIQFNQHSIIISWNTFMNILFNIWLKNKNQFFFKKKKRKKQTWSVRPTIANHNASLEDFANCETNSYNTNEIGKPYCFKYK